MSANAFVVVSGLPASGKSTLARSLAHELGLPHLDKDGILEALYDSLGVGDHAWRNRLSRAADQVLFTIAADAGRAVLDNWWHHDTAPEKFQGLDAQLIEVFCRCDVALAARRFQNRVRHPGHLDPDLTPAQLDERIAKIRTTFPGPLRLGGPLITVDTTGTVDTSELAAKISIELSRGDNGSASPARS
ncbi:AAA family ATPase [Catenulispora subtropica]|uniref:AAA family ATPase n=1 Tax=Catenulispora subtropica TaxID=450798 RepID=A0ABN2SWP2_9ACTN